MASRAQDWFDQGQRNLAHARHDVGAGFHEWAYFSAQQVAEKILKRVYQHCFENASPGALV